MQVLVLKNVHKILLCIMLANKITKPVQQLGYQWCAMFAGQTINKHINWKTFGFVKLGKLTLSLHQNKYKIKLFVYDSTYCMYTTLNQTKALTQSPDGWDEPSKCYFRLRSLPLQALGKNKIDKKEKHLFSIKCPFVFVQYFSKWYTSK